METNTLLNSLLEDNLLHAALLCLRDIVRMHAARLVLDYTMCASVTLLLIV